MGAVGDVDTPHAVLDFYDTSSCGSNGGLERIGLMWSRKVVKAGRLCGAGGLGGRESTLGGDIR